MRDTRSTPAINPKLQRAMCVMAVIGILALLSPPANPGARAEGGARWLSGLVSYVR
jgi:hypothetical protein